MSQISPPMRILLVGAVVFLAAWFTLLRPKATEVPPLTTSNTTVKTTTEPKTGLGKAVASAKKAAGQEKTESATDPATGATTTAQHAKPEAAPAPEIPAEALAKLPKDVARALKARKVLVLGVIADGETAYRPLADDDRYVRNALRRVNRYDGKVFVKSVPSSKLSGYGSLVNALDVNQTPSVVVIDRDLKGKVLTGYVDRITINQVIADARRDSIQPNISDEYLRGANQLCHDYETRVTRWSAPTVPGAKAEIASLKRMAKIVKDYRRAIAKTSAPAKWRGLKSHWLRVMKMREKTLSAFVKAYDKNDADALVSAVTAFDSRDVRKLDRRFNDAGLDCVINRRS